MYYFMDRKNSLKVLKDISAVKYYIEKDSADISEETRNIRDRLLKNFDVIEKAISPRDAILINQINSDKTNKEYVEYAELLKKTKELKYQNI